CGGRPGDALGFFGGERGPVVAPGPAVPVEIDGVAIAGLVRVCTDRLKSSARAPLAEPGLPRGLLERHLEVPKALAHEVVNGAPLCAALVLFVAGVGAVGKEAPDLAGLAPGNLVLEVPEVLVARHCPAPVLAANGTSLGCRY